MVDLLAAACGVRWKGQMPVIYNRAFQSIERVS
jgi:hypothetical protein